MTHALSHCAPVGRETKAPNNSKQMLRTASQTAEGSEAMSTPQLSSAHSRPSAQHTRELRITAITTTDLFYKPVMAFIFCAHLLHPGNG